MKKIVLISALIAAVSIGSIACAAPNKNPQAGDLKANVIPAIRFPILFLQ